MQAVSAAFKTTIEGVDYRALWRVSFDLPIDGYDDTAWPLTSVQVSISVNTNIPAATRLLTGESVTDTTFTLGGMVTKPGEAADETKNASWFFGQYQKTSPLYRKDLRRTPVTIDFGIIPDGGTGPEWIRKFTGLIDDYTANRDGSVDFTCIDNRSKLRSSVTLPAVVTAPPYVAGLTSEFAIDAILRAGTQGEISSWPAPRPGCVLAAGMRTSVWPDIGELDTSVAPIADFLPGPFGSALVPTFAVESGRANYFTAEPLGTSIFVEFFVSNISGGSVQIRLGGDGGFAILVRSNAVVIDYSGADAGPAVVLDDGTHYIAVQLTLPAVGSADFGGGTVYVDDATYTLAPATGDLVRTSAPLNKIAVDVDLVISTPFPRVAGVQVTTETTPTPNNNFAPTAVLDPSLNTLSVMPAVSGDPWAAIQEASEAELGIGLFDENGIFRFYNRSRFKSSSAVRELTSMRSLTDLSIASSAADIVNHSLIPYTLWTFGARATVWSLDGPIRVPRLSLVPITASVSDGLIAALDNTVAFLPDSSPTVGASYYRASIDAAGSSDHTGLSFTLKQVTSTSFTVIATNPTSTDAWLVSSADHVDLPVGTPCLQIGGIPVTNGGDLTADYQFPIVMPDGSGGAVSSKYSEVAYTGSSSDWMQDADTANQLARDVVAAGAVPRPNFNGLAIVPDPRLQIGDRVRLVDTSVHDMDEYAVVFGQTLDFQAGDGSPGSQHSRTHQIDARAVAAPGGWVLGVAGRSELAETTYLYA